MSIYGQAVKDVFVTAFHLPPEAESGAGTSAVLSAANVSAATPAKEPADAGSLETNIAAGQAKPDILKNIDTSDFEATKFGLYYYDRKERQIVKSNWPKVRAFFCKVFKGFRERTIIGQIGAIVKNQQQPTTPAALAVAAAAAAALGEDAPKPASPILEPFKSLLTTDYSAFQEALAFLNQHATVGGFSWADEILETLSGEGGVLEKQQPASQPAPAPRSPTPPRPSTPPQASQAGSAVTLGIDQGLLARTSPQTQQMARDLERGVNAVLSRGETIEEISRRAEALSAAARQFLPRTTRPVYVVRADYRPKEKSSATLPAEK